jgi:hypothetical protein
MITEYLLQYGEISGSKESGYFVSDSESVFASLTYDDTLHRLKNSSGKYKFNIYDTVNIESIGFYLPNNFTLKHNKLKVTFYNVSSEFSIPQLNNNSIIIPSENFEIKLGIVLYVGNLNFANGYEYFQAKLEPLISEDIYINCLDSQYNETIFEVPIFMKISHKFPLTEGEA